MAAAAVAAVASVAAATVELRWLRLRLRLRRGGRQWGGKAAGQQGQGGAHRKAAVVSIAAVVAPIAAHLRDNNLT